MWNAITMHVACELTKQFAQLYRCILRRYFQPLTKHSETDAFTSLFILAIFPSHISGFVQLDYGCVVKPDTAIA